MKHALTIDVEDFFHVAAFNKVIEPKDWDSYPNRVEANTHRFLDLIEAHGTTATFFMLGWVAERFPGLVREIADRGHEIASHGYSHQLIYQQTPDVFKQETLRSKALLEDITQTPVNGYRAASYSITPDSLWALDIISEAGFTYDSSIYPVRHDNYGLRGGPMEPYLLDLANGATLTEFPITTTNLLGMDIPVGGGGYFRLYPFALTRWLLRRRARNTGAPFVFYLHPWEMDPDQPRVDGAGALSNFRHYLNLDKVTTRLTRLMTEFEFTTMQIALDSLSALPRYRHV